LLLRSAEVKPLF